MQLVRQPTQRGRHQDRLHGTGRQEETAAGLNGHVISKAGGDDGISEAKHQEPGSVLGEGRARKDEGDNGVTSMVSREEE